MVERFDQVYRRGNAITFVVKHKPFIDLSIPPSANDYRPATCMNISIYDETQTEELLRSTSMTPVPNRPGWYYYRYQTSTSMVAGLYTAIITSITTIDGIDYTTRNVQEFRLVDDGIQ
jgi:hypothetical protein